MARRKYSREFKLSAVKLVNEQGYRIPDAAKSLAAGRILLLVSFVGLSAGCYWNGPKDRVVSYEPHRAPLQHSKAVEPLGLERATRVVRYDVLYVADTGSLPEADAGLWFRFWPEGRAMYKMGLKFVRPNPVYTPIAANADDFTGAIGCFFSIVGDQITIEYIGLGGEEALVGPKRRYERFKGRINDDGTLTLQVPVPGYEPGLLGLGGKWVPVTFRPLTVEAMSRQPDW